MIVQCGWRDDEHKCADAREKPLPEFERKMEWLYSTVVRNRWNIFNQTSDSELDLLKKQFQPVDFSPILPTDWPVLIEKHFGIMHYVLN